MKTSFRNIRWIALLAAATTSAAFAGDTVFVNAKIFTGNALQPYAEAVAIHDDRIVAVGSETEVRAAAAAGASVVDMKGRTLLPGLIDSHAHPVMAGLWMGFAWTDDAMKKADQVGKVALAALKGGKSMRSDVLEIHGISLSVWSQEDRLNAIFNHGAFAKIPVFLQGMDGHTGWANQLLRTRAGITTEYLKSLPEDKRKYFGHDKNMVPSGFGVDKGLDQIVDHLPDASPETMLTAGRLAVKMMHEWGITGWLDALASRSIIATYKDLSDRHELNTHVAALVQVKAGEADPLANVNALRHEFANVPGLTLPGIKIFMDGVVEFPSQSAAMSKPYAVTGKVGDLLFTPAEFASVATQADKAGLLVHVHSIGDLATTTALDGFAAMRKANGNSGLQHTITHLQFVQPADFDRFKELDVIASVQLLWANAGEDTIDIVKPYVDPQLYPWQYPARSMLDAGATMAGASDWPVSTANPFEAIYEAETRKGTKGVLNADQAMPRTAMLYAYTINAAKVLNQQKTIGSIEAGKQADFALVDRDVMTVSPERLKDTKVLGTMVDGQWVFGGVR
jgi:predicted amidohydrolase YtcJ